LPQTLLLHLPQQEKKKKKKWKKGKLSSLRNVEVGDLIENAV